MKYLTGIFIVFLFLLLDIILIISCLGLIGCFIVWPMLDDGLFPLSYKFAERIWLK